MLGAAAYVVLYVTTYVRVISPIYIDSGLVDNLPRDGSIAIAVSLAVLPALGLPASARRPSDVGLWILYLSGYVPSLIVPAFILDTGWALVPYWLTLAGSFAAVMVGVSRVHLALRRVALPVRVYRWVLIALALGGSTAAVAAFGIPRGLPSLDAVYDVRDEFSEALERVGRFGGYAVWWTGRAVAPLLIAYGVWVRRPLMVISGFGLFALVYGVAGFRSILFVAVLLFGLLLLIHRAPRLLGVLALAASGGLVLASLAVLAAGWDLPISLGVRRLLVVPGQVIAYYYDRFGEGPHYLLSHSVLSGITSSPYTESPAELVGREYYAIPLNANGNLWADGLANFGLLGLAGASVLLAFLLVGLDAAARGRPLLVAVSVGGLSVWSVTNSGILTSLMTHGIGLTAVLLWLLPSRRALGRDRTHRAAHLTSVHRSDDPRILLKECASLAAAGHDVILVGRGAPPTRMPAGVRFESVGDTRSRLARMLALPLRMLLRAWRLRADVYHVHDPELLPIALVLKLSGARVVYDVHEDLPRQIAYKRYIPVPLRGPLAWVAGVIELVAARILDGIVAATPHIASRFPRNKTVVVQNFPLASEFGEREPRPYSQRPWVVAYVGRITTAAGARTMAEAAALLNRPHVRFIFAGPVDQGLESELRALAGTADVAFPGWLDRNAVAELLDGARIGIVVFQPVANYVEAYPTKLFEYMAAAVPVVASDFPVWRSIVDGANCGLLVDPTNPTAVAAGVAKLLDDEGGAAEMATNGRSTVFDRYRWEEQASRLNDFYGLLLRKDVSTNGRRR